MVERLAGLRVFVEAAEAGSFSAAAARLHLSRSAVGKTIAGLEARLGVRLFQRTTRSQSLTAEGQIFHAHCQKALEEIRSGEQALESGRREVGGRLRVTMSALFGRYCVTPLLLCLAAANPALSLELDFSDRVVDLVQDGFDLAVRNGSPGSDPELVSRRIAQQRHVLVAAPAVLAREGVPRDLGDLTQRERVVYQSGRTRSWHFADGSQIPATGRLRLNDLEAIAEAAAAGFGIAYLPHWLVRPKAEEGRLAILPFDPPCRPIDVFAVWPSAKYLPARLRLAIDTLAAELPGAVG